MLRWFGKSLKHKLSILLVISILLPVLLFGIFSYWIASGITEEKTKLSGMNSMRQLSTNLEFVIRDLENISVHLIGQDTIQGYLSSEEPNVSLQTAVISMLIDLAAPKQYIFDISVVPDNKSLRSVSVAPVVKTELPDIQMMNPEYFSYHSKWWSPLHEMQTTSGSHQVITMVHPVRSIGKYKRIGAIHISIPEKELASILQESGVGSNSVLLLNSEDKVISAQNRSWINQTLYQVFPGMEKLEQQNGFTEYGKGSSKNTVIYYTVPKVDWKLVYFVPYDQYTSENRYVLLLTAIASGIAIFIIIGLILFFVQWITKPLQALTTFLKHANPNEPLPAYHVSSKDEVGMLVNSYNKLRKRILSLTEQVKYKEELKKQADIRALQAQINPHFLYNTLSSIRWKALMKKEQDIADMVGNLGDFLQFSLNKGKEFCSVQQEVAHAFHYSNIQSIRFPDKFEIDFTIKQDMKHKEILKLLLQPIIENALIHGIQKKKDRGRILVSGFIQDSRMVFIIEDDGIGFDPDKLEQLLSILDEPIDDRHNKNTSYGLRNVHQRLILHYGKEAGLSIKSQEGQGTKVKFSISMRGDM
jgi:two-component system sensor histidine kinase YesM